MKWHPVGETGFHECASCHGIWLGEPVQKIVLQASVHHRMAPGALAVAAASGRSFLCPECQEPLGVFRVKDVELDRCRRCKGVWFDAGEFTALAAVGAPLTQKVAEQAKDIASNAVDAVSNELVWELASAASHLPEMGAAAAKAVAEGVITVVTGIFEGL